MPQELKDWIWRLDRIQQEMELLIPSGNLHVLFTLKVDFHASSTKEMETFPFGRALSMADWPAAKYTEPDTGALWFDLGRGVVPFVMRWDYDDWSIHEAMPKGFYPKGRDGAFLCDTLAWCRWYYLKGDDCTEPTDRERIAGRVVELEEAILEACDLAPHDVLRKVGNLSALGCWPTSLFYLAMKRLHPLIQAFGTHIPNHPIKHNPDKDSSFVALNDRCIMLSPDFRAATCHAFDLFRHAAQNIAGLNDASLQTQMPKACAANQSSSANGLSSSSADQSRQTIGSIVLRSPFGLGILLVSQALVVLGDWLWGAGDTLWQKIGNSWELHAAMLGALAVVCMFFQGRERWRRHKLSRGDDK
ncbi:MAG TPA: hypothetical protein DCX07_08135 [Phycisphaerales bacterium]|nr:hypothetical protein [Phycisphaerales bacterium]